MYMYTVNYLKYNAMRSLTISTLAKPTDEYLLLY